ncbi:Pseudo-HPr [Phocoenobacter uteri]|uniref:Pseudo-HPr n=1 Tax=Phocoenobacter uteri TaxID=146806 RepID=A0A379C8D9_9PAST|nr:fused PTS fructose transporter subunit IIA/HPr protein [Phocoenobacter uteri]MDG6882405.1 hypothetical protein [Phocoenobacter uteri]SUB58563.1 Pseudo-HPr [Phocoenobacter uteri]
MLALSNKNVQLNAAVDNKADAIRLVALGLTQNGNVKADYEAGMLARETQTSTYLGNGIAIPHGTLNTRHLVENTGVQVCQFPKGVDWGEGNIAYVVIGIAAKSDEHLTLLRQLTAILGDDKATEQLAKTQDIEEFIAILSGKKQLPVTAESLISLNTETASLLTLSALNAEKLQQQGYVEQAFVGELLESTLLKLADNLFINDAKSGNQANGIAVARATAGQTVVTIANADETMNAQLEKLLNKEVQQTLVSGSVADVVALFVEQKSVVEEAGVAEGLEATFEVLNEHGLHARPSAVLVNEVKKYDAEILVQNLDRDTPLVKAKSLMKVVSLGVQKGHKLRFVATGNEAQKALDGIGLAIQSKLGE